LRRQRQELFWAALANEKVVRQTPDSRGRQARLATLERAIAAALPGNDSAKDVDGRSVPERPAIP
jgi:hypothetical protein